MLLSSHMVECLFNVLRGGNMLITAFLKQAFMLLFRDFNKPPFPSALLTPLDCYFLWGLFKCERVPVGVCVCTLRGWRGGIFGSPYESGSDVAPDEICLACHLRGRAVLLRGFLPASQCLRQLVSIAKNRLPLLSRALCLPPPTYRSDSIRLKSGASSSPCL